MKRNVLMKLYIVKILTLCITYAAKTIYCRYQIWPLDKKIRVARQAKDYLKRHASEVEQRLAQDRTFNAKVKTAKLKFVKWMQVINFYISLMDDLGYDILLCRHK